MTTAAALAVLVVNSAPSIVASDAAPKVRVYVYTSSAGSTSDEEKGRLDSVRDVEEVVRGKSQFTLVSTADEAQVIVEIVNREERSTPEGGFGGKSVSRFRETIVRLKVRAGEEQGELKGVGQASWTSAAKDAVKRLSKWVKNHKIADR